MATLKASFEAAAATADAKRHSLAEIAKVVASLH
jgi:hypothetical protein